MYVRIVRFDGVTPERVESVVDRIKAEGPPPGNPVRKVQLFYDHWQETAVVLQFFGTDADMRKGAQQFADMDPGDTPGVRQSVDMCGLAIEARA